MRGVALTSLWVAAWRAAESDRPEPRTLSRPEAAHAEEDPIEWLSK
jgi:hypothetical protein